MKGQPLEFEVKFEEEVIIPSGDVRRFSVKGKLKCRWNGRDTLSCVVEPF